MENSTTDRANENSCPINTEIAEPQKAHPQKGNTVEVIDPNELRFAISNGTEDRFVSFHFHDLHEVILLITRLTEIALHLQTGQQEDDGVLPDGSNNS
jgi:hypothetical protein